MIKINSLNIIYISICIVCLYSCNKESSEIPTYLTLNPSQFEQQANTGTTNQNIEDYWLYVGNELIGVFHPGQSAPVIGNDVKDLSIHAGIRSNGLRDNAVIYPFFDNYRSQVDLCACADSINIQPTFKYLPTAKFSFIEDFENDNRFSVDVDENPNTSSIVQSVEVMEGGYSLALNVDSVNRINAVTTQSFYNDFASDGRDVYIEFNYKSDFNFLIGLEASTKGGKAFDLPFGLYSSDTWKKMYINLKDLVVASKAEFGYRVVFSVQHPGGTIRAGKLYLDNIKLVHY